MTTTIQKTASHTVTAFTAASKTVDGVEYFPTYLVAGDATEIGAANALHVQPGTGASWAITAAALPLPSGAAIAAKQPAIGTAGTPSADVISIQGVVSGTAVPISDGGGSITVDGSVSVSGSVSVTNAGTFAVQVDGTALTRLTDIETNTDSGAVVGNGTAATAQRVTLASDSTGTVTLGAGTAAIGKLAANSGVTIGAVEIAAAQTLGTVTTVSTVTNLSQIGGVAVAMGTGVRSAGTQRVTIATDDVVPASQSGTWTVGLSASQTLATVTTVGTVTTCSTVTTLTGGGVAHDGADSGNPIKVGGKAVTTQSGQTAVASGDRSDLIQDLDGAVIDRPHCHGDNVSGAASTTGTSDTSAVAAQGASTYFYCTGWSIANTGSTTTLITFKDGSGGSVLGYTIAPTGSGSNFSAGGKPLFRTSANTALYFACGSASTTVYVTFYGYKSKV